jgi:hypothetical protein
MFMPYKLKDSGVTLKYKGEAAMQDGRMAEVVTLTFSGVGLTPRNRYDVYIASDTELVEQWAYYDDAADAEPRFISPWREWRRYGPGRGILLSGDRGERDGRPLRHTDIGVYADLPRGVFTSSGPVSAALGFAPDS